MFHQFATTMNAPDFCEHMFHGFVWRYGAQQKSKKNMKNTQPMAVYRLNHRFPYQIAIGDITHFQIPNSSLNLWNPRFSLVKSSFLVCETPWNPITVHLCANLLLDFATWWSRKNREIISIPKQLHSHQQDGKSELCLFQYKYKVGPPR